MTKISLVLILLFSPPSTAFVLMDQMDRKTATVGPLELRQEIEAQVMKSNELEPEQFKSFEAMLLAQGYVFESRGLLVSPAKDPIIGGLMKCNEAVEKPVSIKGCRALDFMLQGMFRTNTSRRLVILYGRVAVQGPKNKFVAMRALETNIICLDDDCG